MGLVDYGSDSDDDSAQPTPSSSSSSSSALNLPPPASRLNLPKPAATAPVAPSKPSAPAPAPPAAKKGKVRILLDLPPPSAPGTSSSDAQDDGPAKKRPKLALGSSGGGGGGLTGLAAMLPKPKNDVKPAAVPPPPKPATGQAAGVGGLFDGSEEKKADKAPAMFLPPSVAAKGKGKAPAKAAPPPPAEPAVDFFGIGSVTSAPSTSSSSSSKPSISSAPSLSAAPSVSSAPSTSASSSAGPSAVSAFKQPTADDPYPGFAQLPSGEWVAKDPATYEAWMAWQAQQAVAPSPAASGAGEDIPRGFADKDVAGQGGYVDVDEAQRARDAWATRPSQVPGREKEYKKASDVKGIGKAIGGNARRKGQLSSLLAAAHDNRAELEDRIAQARANRKSAGNKYGF
ncbi:hypothetical protein JCM10207_002725 [Rhodosporidiobolus poonsookiae]